jgi:succinate dehydrogenase/fumarate reductase flavoprotein subunit
MTQTDSGSAVDIIVVGGGGSGLAAAISARYVGANVLLLEKYHELRGSTGLSIGSVTATGTWHQKRAGIQDSPEEHFEDMPKFAGTPAPVDNVALRRILVENVTETVDWLMQLGVQFYGPMPEPPHRKPRMHNVLPNSRAFIYFLSKEARRVGVTIKLRASVDRLLVENERVVGVECQIDGVKKAIYASRAVILATGDLSSSPESKKRFRPDLSDVEGVNTTSTGDGQRLAEQLGSEIRLGEFMYGPNLRFLPPAKPSILLSLPPYKWLTMAMRIALERMPSWILRPFILTFVTTYLGPEPSMYKEGAILVNKNGERFVDELNKPNFAFSSQPDQIGYIVFDASVARKFRSWPHFVSTAPGVAYAYVQDYKRNRPDLYHEQPTLEKLAVSIGAPRESLDRTVREYNSEAHPDRPPLSNGPYYALGPVKSWVIVTDGGVTVNSHHQVTRGDGKVISGLYAVGSAGQGGLFLDGHGHHLGWAFTSGRLAGRHAAGSNRP